MVQSTRMSLLAASATLLLSGCLEGIEAPESVRMEDASVGEAPPPIQVAIRSLLDGPATVNVGPLGTPWLSADQASLEIEPGGSATVELTAAACEEAADRVGALALSADGRLGLVRVEMACISALDARFGDVSAHQGARIGPTEFNPVLEIPVINDRPGAFRAEVLATFDPTAHIEVEAVVLDADGEPLPGISPLERLRDPVEFDHATAAYAAVHEFEAPSQAFDEDVEVVLRIDPDRRLADDVLSNNEARPLEGAPRLPEALPSYHFHLLSVTMTILKDGEEHVLSAVVPDCPGPAGCLSGTLDMMPLPTDLVEVTTHALDIGPLEWTDEHDGEPWGMAHDVMAEIRGRMAAEAILDPDIPAPRQIAVAFVFDDASGADWSRNAFVGLAGNPILVLHAAHRHLSLDAFRDPNIIAHEVGHLLNAEHAWSEAAGDAGRGRLCGWTDPDFPYAPNDGMISGDPDGNGPLRVRPAYARLGSAGEVEPVFLAHQPDGFLDQTLLVDDVMNCRGRSEAVDHVSDYHYLIALFGAGWKAEHSWATWWEDDACIHDGMACPWRRGGSTQVTASAKSAVAGLDGPKPSAAKVHVSGYVDAAGRFLERGAYARLGNWPSRRAGPSGDHVLIAYDASGMPVHEQPIVLLPAFHLEGLSGRYAAVVPRDDVARVEVRDGSGALMLSLDVAE